MDRRDFFKSLALAGAVFTVKQSGAMTLMNMQTSPSGRPSGPGNFDLVAVLGGEPDQMFQKAITEMGGIGKFIRRGQTVIVKPNIAWDRAPEYAANTNPILVGEIVRQCINLGAKEVLVFDHTCDEWRKCYANSGIEAAVHAAGGRMLPANLESYYKPVSLPRGRSLKATKIFETLLEADTWINVPILKHHGGSRMTIAMKNLMGIVWDRRFFHANNLHQCIADVCTLQQKPVLNVVDAYRLMKANGPQGRSLADVVLSKGIFLSHDMVAVDTAATNFFNQVREMPLRDVEHLFKGEELNVGTTNLESLRISRKRV